MKAVRLYGKGDLRVEDIMSPEPPARGWVALKVAAAGICGSDLHNFRTGQWISRSPSTAGHEFAGVVTALGEGVEGLAVGDHVVADSRFWCGECAPCLEGRPHLCAHLGFVGEVCDGGFAEEAVLPAKLLVRIVPDLPPSIAAMAEPFAVALHAVRRLAPEPGTPVLVAGCGPIGGLVALILSRSHDGKILVADRNSDRAALVARVAGATVVELTSASVSAAIGNRSLRSAVDATGSVPALKAMVDCLSGGARIALVGIFHEKLDLDVNILVERELSFLGCHAFSDELPQAAGMLTEYAPALQQLIDREISLAEVPRAYERLLGGEVRGLKTIIRMQQ